MHIQTTILKHRKTGGYYYQLYPELDWRREADMHEMFAYRPIDVKTVEDRRRVFLRPIEELEDGRFKIESRGITYPEVEKHVVELIQDMNTAYRYKWKALSVITFAIGFTAGLFL